MQQLLSLFHPDQISIRHETRIAYSRDASRIHGECLAVVWPETIEDMIRLIGWAAEEPVPAFVAVPHLKTQSSSTQHV